MKNLLGDDNGDAGGDVHAPVKFRRMDPHNDGFGSEKGKIGWKWMQIGDEEAAAGAVDENMRRTSRRPPPRNSGYAARVLRVFNRIIQLLSLQRTTSHDEELELLFTGLHN